MGNTRISIAMATFNGGRFVQEQLESIARQSLLPHELVICDDGSVDETKSLLDAFASRAPFPVRVYANSQPLGPGSNFLRAASLCTGDWIGFCDQDDVWLPAKLARCAEVIEWSPRLDMISHSAMQVGEHLEKLPGVPNHPDHKRLSVTGPLRNIPMRALPGFSCIFRRSMFESVPYEDRPSSESGYDPLQPHDGFVYNVINTYGYLVRIPDVLALHRRHGGAVTGARGSGIKKKFGGRRYVSRGVDHGRALMGWARAASSHRQFYEHLLERIPAGSGQGDFDRRTSAAVEYYGFLQASYATRAEIYLGGKMFTKKIVAMARCVGSRAYSDHVGGKGIGPKGFLRDLAAVFLMW